MTNSAAYKLAAAVIGLGLFASVTPSPLYHTYSALWHFSPLTLTLIYATYAFGVLATLLLAGRLSDEVGRRPVLLVALGVLMGSTVLFIVADSVAWLFVARGLQGLATGAALSAASAALLDLHPRRDPARVSLTNGVASAAGLGLGILSSSALVQLGYAPRVLPYLVLLTLFALAFVGAYLMPEPVATRSRPRLAVERPSVPSVVRRPFVLAALAVLSSWSIGGLFFSLGPQLGAHLFGSSDVIVASIGIVALAASAAFSQLVFGRTAPWIGASAGSIALAIGTLMIVAATTAGSGRRIPRGLDRRRARVRHGVPRRPARADRVDSAGAPRIRHVGVLRRGVRVAVGSRRRRRSRRRAPRTRDDVRDVRQRRRRDRARRRGRGLAHAPPSSIHEHRNRRSTHVTSHPETHTIDVVCATCGTVHTVRSTASALTADVCSNCHPVYTGRERATASGSRIERFNRRYALTA